MPQVDPEMFIVPAWMRLAADGRRLQLVGQHCRSCGVTMFPRTARCKACGSADSSEVMLGPDATLHSVTLDGMGGLLGRPTLIGQIQFAEGPFVQGFVDAPLDAEPQIGSAIELVPFSVPAPGREGSLITYGFHPKGGNECAR